MDEKELQGEFYTLTDEDGNELEFEVIGSAEIGGVMYYAMVPCDEATAADDVCEYVILKAHEDGEDIVFESIEDDDEFEKAEEYFNDVFFNEIDYDQN